MEAELLPFIRDEMPCLSRIDPTLVREPLVKLGISLEPHSRHHGDDLDAERLTWLVPSDNQLVEQALLVCRAALLSDLTPEEVEYSFWVLFARVCREYHRFHRLHRVVLNLKLMEPSLLVKKVLILYCL